MAISRPITVFKRMVAADRDQRAGEEDQRGNGRQAHAVEHNAAHFLE